jgi:serine/threonine-protein kinase
MVLYELLAGVHAFAAETRDDLFLLINHAEPPALLAYRSDVPQGLEEVIRRCIQKVPEDRFQNIAELAIALLPFGPKRARICAERASHALWSAGLTQTRLRVGSTAPPPPDGRSSIVSGEPSIPPASRSGGSLGALLDRPEDHAHGMALHVETGPPQRRALVAGVAIAVVIAAAIAVAVVLRQPAPHAATTPPTPPATSTMRATDSVKATSAVPVTVRPPAPEIEAAPAPATTKAAEQPATDTDSPQTPPLRPIVPVAGRPQAVTQPGPDAPKPAAKPKPNATADEPDLGY